MRKVSSKPDKTVCACGKGYASQDKSNPWYGMCKICFCSPQHTTRRELKLYGLKRS